MRPTLGAIALRHTPCRSRPIVAVGLQGLIQATRDTTQAAFSNLQAVALPLLAGGLLFLGTNAWREGAAYRKRAASAEMSPRDFGLLALCILIDAFGNTSLFLGDASDVIWAPLSAFLVFSIFESPAVALLNFVKEGLLFTDVIPVATVAWLLTYAFPESQLARALGLERPSQGEDEDPTATR